MQERIDTELGFKDYFAILKRRGMLFLLIAAPIVTIGVALAFRLPAVYESVGVLLVEQSEVPDYIVRSTIPDFPNERVRRISERVLTEENLHRIADEHAVYPELTARDPEEAVREMRRNLITGAEDPELLPTLVARNENTIAFRVGFSHSTPDTALAVARDLVSLYLTENQRARQELARETLAFLEAESRRLEEQMAAKEAELADFKRENAGRLPELEDMNMQLLDRTERDLQTVDTEIRGLRQRISLIETELSQLSPYAVVLNEQGQPLLSPADQLKSLQRQYVQSTANYGPGHPDISRLRRQIDALAAQTGLPALDRSVLEMTLAAQLAQLEAARERGLTDDHPDVVRLQAGIENLRADLAEAPRAPPSRPASAAPPDNPVYIERQVQLEATRGDLQAALERRDQLRASLASYEQRLTATPEVEREFASLSRGYEQLVNQYNEVRAKQQEAAVAVTLESENRGERFSVLSSPARPARPAQPNRIAILLLALTFAFAAGAGGIALAEVTDATVRAPRDVLALLEIPPLVMIPYIDNESDLRDRRWKRFAVAASVCMWVGITAFFVMTPAG